MSANAINMKGVLRFLLMTTILGNSSFAQSGDLYCGTIQTKTTLPIVFDLSKHRYFYRKHKQAISLTLMSQSDKAVTLAEGGKDSKIQFQLTKNKCPDDEKDCVGLSGFWQNGKDKHPVKLFVIRGHNDLPFELLRDGVNPETVSMGTTEVKLLPKALNNLDYEYQVTKFKDAGKIPSLNKMLNRNLGEYDAKSPCEDILNSAYFEDNHSFNLITENILVIEHRVEGWGRGTPYPLNNEGGETYYDLANQTELDLKHIFLNFEKNREAILRIFLGKKINEAKTLAKKAKVDANGDFVVPEDQESCWTEYLPDTLFEKSFEVHIDIVKKQLGLAQSFPHAMLPCSGEFEYVKTSVIEKYLDKKTELYRYLTSQENTK